jgi:hypothetical protein
VCGTEVEIEPDVIQERLNPEDTKMNTLKGWITTTFLVGTLALSTIPANAGVIIGGSSASGDSTCTETTKKTTRSQLGGVIIGGGFAGVIIGGIIGVIIGGIADEPVNCGVIIGG